MNIMIIGNGGRESAIRWKLLQNARVEKIFSHGDLYGLKTSKDYCEFAQNNNIDLTIVGSEEMLVNGIVDDFNRLGLKIFGPTQKAAVLEGSKAVAKAFMNRHGIRTAAYGIFDKLDQAVEYAKKSNYPLVIKASGLAAGKGVFIVNTEMEAAQILEEVMVRKSLGDAGNRVVIEEFLDGVEASILSVFDGNKIVPFISAKDHKKIGENETGPNTGGMGVIAPNPYVTKEVLEAFNHDILLPTQEGLKKEQMQFAGVIFFGIMITKQGIYLLEYNMRMGDPETQAVLPLMESDLLDVIEQAMQGNLQKIDWKDQHSCCVVIASKGYPGNYEKGKEISGLDKVSEEVFWAGVKDDNGVLKTNGGRVMGIVGLGNTSLEAREKAYTNVKQIHFEEMYYRNDIGL